ncbi:MAG: DNA-binding response regulator [Ignavibacteriae bacterium]|nr:MAG: DNA-binding response regulator [Ignavibacteriota bacterium]
MNQLTSIIVDDELAPRENLKLVIEQYCPEIKCLRTAENAVTAKNLIELFSPDIVFLDIDMPELNGFDLLEMLPCRNFMLVFVTAYEEFAIDAIRANAIDYLIKPINVTELKNCVMKLVELKNEKISRNNFKPTTKVIIPQTNGFIVIEEDEIIRVEGEDCYTHIYLSNSKKVTVSKTLKEFENILVNDMFFRNHKSHIINLKYFKEFYYSDGGYAVLTDGTKLEISRRRQKEFIEKVKYLHSK